MAHVHIKQQPKGGFEVTIDGVRVEKKILARGFSVDIPEDFQVQPTVTMVVATEVLDIELPDCVVKATRESTEDPSC